MDRTAGQPPFDFDTLTDRSRDGTAKWARRTEAEKAAGIVPLTVADMEFKCAPAVVEAVTAAARQGLYGYTDADDAYYNAVIGWMDRRHGWPVEQDWIVPENGVVPALSVAVRALTEPGDQVLIQTPGYPPFSSAAASNGRVAVHSSLLLGEDGFYRMDLEDFRRKAADPRTKLFILCSPHNPVGRVWTVEELQAVAAICLAHDVLVVSDEIHFDLILQGTHTVFCQAVPEMLDRCVICTAPSKTFNVAGLQQANTIIPNAALRERFRARMNADGYGNVSKFGYNAVIAAYNESEAWLDTALPYIRANFAHLNAWLAQYMPQVRLLPAQGTYLAWTDWRALGLAQEALERFLREEAMLIANGGTQFGPEGEGFMRLNLALPRAALSRVLERLLMAAKARGFA